jgi:hypothetical protein
MSDIDLSAVRAPEQLAQAFHEAYERLAPSFGYETREASAKPWAEVPDNNRALMTAVCAEIGGAVLARLAEVEAERDDEVGPPETAITDLQASFRRVLRERDSLARRCAVRFEETEKLRTRAEAAEAERDRALAVVEAARVLAAVGEMYLAALDDDPANEALTLPEAMRVTMARDALAAVDDYDQTTADNSRLCDDCRINLRDRTTLRG